MSMNKKIVLLVLFLCSMFVFKANVNAQHLIKTDTILGATTVGVNCEAITAQADCTSDKGCAWDRRGHGKCNFAYVLENPCNESNILRVLHIFGYFLLIAKILIPLLIIGFGTFDIFNSVIDKDEKSLTKQLRILGIRIISGLIVFFLPDIVYLVFGMSNQTNTYQQDGYQACAECVLKPLSGNCNYD